MKKKLGCILLIDDNLDDNFFHEREIKKTDFTNVIITKTSGLEALKYLTSKPEHHTDLIFLDINMPGMNGWEFLEEYKKLDKKMQSRAIIVMLTTSINSDDLAKAKTYDIVTDYIAKPLTKGMMKYIANKYFN